MRRTQTWTFAGIHKSTTINALVSLSLDPATKDSDFVQVKYHKDQANAKDYSHEGTISLSTDTKYSNRDFIC